MRDNKVKMRLHIKLNNYIHPIPTSPGQAMAAAQCDPIHLSIYLSSSCATLGEKFDKLKQP